MRKSLHSLAATIIPLHREQLQSNLAQAGFFGIGKFAKQQMKHIWLLALALMASTSLLAQAEEIEEIRAALEEAESARERMVLRYELAEAYLRVDAEQAEDFGKSAHNAARDQNNNGMAARAAYIVAKAYERQRDRRNQEVWLRTTLNYAKQAGDSDLILRSVQERGALAKAERNERRAIQIYEEAFNYFSQNGRSISDLEAQYETLRSQIEREKRSLQQERDQLEFQVRNLRLESDQLSEDKTHLERQTAVLSEENRQKEEEISNKSEELETIAEEKARAERRAREKTEEVEELSEAVAKQRLVEQELKNENMQNQLTLEQQQKSLYAAIGASGIVLLLALLFYSRFRAKRKAANTLAEKNKQVEEERQRSDELLLNILPASIATELKENGKAMARQFSEATVLFSDFKNFTRIAELLSPEELVQELDKCFKAFDFIIGQYEDIEKIKTIGDAYMCASGLSDRKGLPNSIVKAALEMQEFLEEQRQERERIGKPYFEARIGIHTGPVVAGVVGVKKFAYDIWGDTVNIAARVEANSETGRVNISETTYRLIKYQFECIYRGKVEAKNKGMLDMYYVQKELAAVPA